MLNLLKSSPESFNHMTELRITLLPGSTGLGFVLDCINLQIILKEPYLRVTLTPCFAPGTCTGYQHRWEQPGLLTSSPFLVQTGVGAQMLIESPFPFLQTCWQ